MIGDLLTRQVTECFGFQPDGSYSMRHLSVGHDEPLRAELLAFVSAIRDGGSPRSPARRASRASKIAIRCLEGTPAAELRRATRSAPRRRLIVVD